MSMVTDRLLRLVPRKYAASAVSVPLRSFRNGGPQPRLSSPPLLDSPGGRSTLITSAPRSASVCGIGGATFALSYVDVAEPARIGEALRELRAVALSNVQGKERSAAALQMKGATANDQSVRIAIEGRLPNGEAVREEVALFTRG